MSAFDTFLAELLKGAKGLVGDAAKDFLKKTIDENEAFARETETYMKRWTVQRAAKDITQAEYNNLVRGHWDEAMLKTLTKAGVAATEIQRLRDQLIDLVIKAAFKAFVP